MRDFIQLKHTVSKCTLDNNSKDRALWDGKLIQRVPTKDMYLWLEDRGVSDTFSCHIWSLRIPLKIKIFLWLLSKRRLLTRANLRRRGWVGDYNCAYCSHLETTNHLFFGCPHIQIIWSWFLQKIHRVFVVSTLEEFIVMIDSLDRDYREAIQLCSVAILWTCWLQRNKRCFQNSGPITMLNFIIKIKVLTNSWAVMWNSALKHQVQALLAEEGNLESMPLQLESGEAIISLVQHHHVQDRAEEGRTMLVYDENSGLPICG